MTTADVQASAFETEPKVKQFHLDDYAEHWARMQELKDLAAEYEVYKNRFKELAGDADELVLNGEVVATNTVSGKFQPSQLARELPHIHAAYMKDKVVRVFDEEAFKAHQPFMWGQYRSRSLRHKK